MDLLKQLLGASLPQFQSLTAAQWLTLGIRVGMIVPEFIAAPGNITRDTRLKLDDVIVEFEKEIGLLK